MIDHPRNLKKIGEEYEKLWEKVWWNRHMAHSTSRGEPHEGKEAARRIEATWGREFLEPGDELEWGICLGKMMALAWVLGADWDEAGDT